MLSVLDIFRVGIGPSSSHTVGPMRIAFRYLDRLERLGVADKTETIKVMFRGSLAFTGHGHGTPRAALLGLLGFEPETINMGKAEAALEAVYADKKIPFGKRHIRFDPETDLILDYDRPARLHPNEMEIQAFDAAGKTVDNRIYYSTGGGFIASVEQLENPPEDDLIPAAPQYARDAARRIKRLAPRAEALG